MHDLCIPLLAALSLSVLPGTAELIFRPPEPMASPALSAQGWPEPISSSRKSYFLQRCLSVVSMERTNMAPCHLQDTLVGCSLPTAADLTPVDALRSQRKAKPTNITVSWGLPSEVLYNQGCPCHTDAWWVLGRGVAVCLHSLNCLESTSPPPQGVLPLGLMRERHAWMKHFTLAEDLETPFLMGYLHRHSLGAPVLPSAACQGWSL